MVISLNILNDKEPHLVIWQYLHISEWGHSSILPIIIFCSQSMVILAVGDGNYGTKYLEITPAKIWDIISINQAEDLDSYICFEQSGFRHQILRF